MPSTKRMTPLFAKQVLERLKPSITYRVIVPCSPATMGFGSRKNLMNLEVFGCRDKTLFPAVKFLLNVAQLLVISRRDAWNAPFEGNLKA